MNEPQDEQDSQQEATKITKKVEIFEADIPKDLQQKAIARVSEAMAKYTIEKDIATDIKKYFDEDCGGSWHCVAGRSFGCSVTHGTKYLFFFRVEQLYLLLFRSPE